MKVTLNWLKQYVDFDWSAEQLAERLTMLGLEVESMSKVGGEFAGGVVAQVLSKDKVPGSDKLSACRVNDGTGERMIICGAQNHNPGDKVPLILPNFALPLKAGEKEPFVIKERKVFGITSQGMMCSPQELGLPDEVDGLLLLPAEARVGQPFAEYLGRSGSDVVYDLEITPNRPDWASRRGSTRRTRYAVPADPHTADILSPPASPAPHLYRVEADPTQAPPVRARPSRRWSPAPAAGQTPAARDVERARCCLLAGFVRLHLRSGGRGHFSTLHLAGYPRSRHNVGVRHGDDEPSHRRRGRLPRNDGQD